MRRILGAHRLVVAHGLFEFRHMDDVTATCFLCFVQHGGRFWKWLRDYFGLSKWRPQKQKLFSSKKNGENGAERLIDNLKMPELEEISTTVAIVCYRYERLAVLQNVFAIILLWASESVELLSSSKVKKKRKSRGKVAFVTWKMPKLAQINPPTESSSTRQVCVFFVNS